MSLDDDFFELGGQSLIVVRLFSRIKKTYAINLSISIFFEARTIRKLAAVVRESSLSTRFGHGSRRAVVAIQANGTRHPLFVFPGKDGEVLGYHRLAEYLGEDQPVYGVVPRGVDGLEPYDTRVEDMAEYFVNAIREARPEGPYCLLGHSFGGMVAFEAAQQLVAQGSVVSHLVLLDTVEENYRKRFTKSLRLRHRLAMYRSDFKLAMQSRDPLAPLRGFLGRRISKVVSSIAPAPPARLRKIRRDQLTKRACLRPRSINRVSIRRARFVSLHGKRMAGRRRRVSWLGKTGGRWN